MKRIKKKTELEKSNFRFNFIIIVVYMIGVILLIQLFNLQIVQGNDYRDSSNTRLTREAKIEAARGSIGDRTGNILVSTEMAFSLEMYKTKVDDQKLNESILLMTTILESNGDSYIDPFPITINPCEYHFKDEESLMEWKKKYKIPETASAEEALYLFRDRYNINSENMKEIRQVLAIRYAIETVGYSTIRSMEISNSISRTSVVQLEEQSNNLVGINIVVEPVRKYHMGTLASHIIGYASRMTKENKDEFERIGDTYEYENNDKVGETGIEKVFEELLRGEDGKKQIDMSVDGIVTGEYTAKEAIGGSNIYLTIDANLQRIAEEQLEANIMKIREGGFGQVYDAKGGSVVVTNVKTGEILAMASYPDYDPSFFYNGISTAQWQEYSTDPNKPLINKAIQNAYPPGSIFKMVTAIAALESEVVKINEYIADNGPYYIDDDTRPACWLYNSYGYGHGRLNVSGAIEKSCNVFFYEVSSRMGIDVLADYASYFGLGKKTGIELYGEKSGTLAERSLGEKNGYVWSRGHTVIAAIGQGSNNYTPIQIAKYVTMVANDGKKVDLSLIKSIVSADGTQMSKSDIEAFVNKKLGLSPDDTPEKDIKPENIKAVKEGMKSVTGDSTGTAYSIFKDFEIEVGGKTGSAETGTPDVHAWFVGFAPYNDPEIAVTVMVENGGHGYYTAEVVREIVAEYFGMNVQNITEDMSAEYEVEMIR